jgi:hypothetical protein
MSKMKFILAFIILLIVSLPLAVILTILIHPFWNWFETLTGIESYGHSGPADWCYLTDYAIIAFISTYVLFRSYKSVKK